MKHTLAMLYGLLFLLCAGCARHKMAPPAPPPPPESILESGSQDSLFKGDQAVLSDQDIARILGTHVNLSDRHRLAILNLDGQSWWSDELAEVEARNSRDLLAAFKTSPQFTEVRFLPSLLVPEKRTVPYLREAAARIQAGLLFVYDTRIETFRRDRLFKSDEVHAQCIAEGVLLDVRTGIVVHTGRSTQNISMQKTSSDLNFNETVARAESQARGKAVVVLANEVVRAIAEEK